MQQDLRVFFLFQMRLCTFKRRKGFPRTSVSYRSFSATTSTLKNKPTSLFNAEYERLYHQSISQPDEFWGQAAEGIHWFKKWEKVLDESNPPFFRWFSGAITNTCYNALDRHVLDGRGDQLAVIYDSPVTGKIQTFTYKELLHEVSHFAGILTHKLGIEKGDTVVIYMPMIPQALIAMLACSRIGAIHSVVFGGFASDQLAQRINHASPKAIISASCGFGPGNVPIPYTPLLIKAIEMSQNKPTHVIVYQRPEFPAELPSGYLEWDNIISGATPVDCTPVAATDPLYILYTSGTTGNPKGVVRDTGGHLVALKWAMTHVYGVEPGDVFFAASDIGWVVGHSFICYGPLINGNTTILYEGKPVGTPDAGAFFRVCSAYNVNAFFAAPTAFRAIKRDDPEGKLVSQYDLKNLRALFLAGERSDPDTLIWAEKLLNVPVIDHWWQTETGWPMASNFMGIGNSRFPTRYGSVTKSVPGWSIDVVDDHGVKTENDKLGNIVAKLPLPPGTLPTLYKNDEGYIKSYLQRFPGYYHTGDAGYRDRDGYLSVMTRTDDIINVSGVRISTGAIEEVLAQHPSVAECAVIGPNDDFRGQIPVGFIVLKSGVSQKEEDIYTELIKLVRDKVGSVAFFKKVIAVPSLPKTRSGKVLRVVLKNMANGLPPNPPGTIEDYGAINYAHDALKKLGFSVRD